MRVAVVTPWRTSDPWRTRAWTYVSQHLTIAGYRPTPYDSGSEPFSRAGSRNLAVRTERDADVVILHDADMVAPARSYRAMATLAVETGRLVVGFSEYRALDERTTTRVLKYNADPFAMKPIGTTLDWSTGGIIAITPDGWARVGGMDERFRGWGCEDFAFAHAASVVLGPLVRLQTPAVHLWHPRPGAEREYLDENAELMAEYLATRTLEDVRAVRVSGAVETRGV